LTSQGADVAPPPETAAPAVAPVAIAPAATAAPDPPTTPPPPDPTVTVLGDSVLLGVEGAFVDELTADGHVVDYRARPAMMLHQATDRLEVADRPIGETVIIGLGHNTLWERDRANFEYWAEKFDREAEELVATAERRGAERIVWVTLREPSAAVIPPEGREQFDRFVWYFPYVNERLDALVAKHPDVVLADWAAVSDAPGLTYDAMHLTPDGIRLMIDTIRQAGGI
jgi:hypothetical protein